MDQFERLVATLLEADGYWVRQSHRIKLTSEEKAEIESHHTSPRVEIDLIAYKPATNDLQIIEVKSFHDSDSGVTCSDIDGTNSNSDKKYPLVRNPARRELTQRLVLRDLQDQGLVTSTAVPSYCLVLGKASPGESNKIRNYLLSIMWRYWGPEDIKARLQKLAKTGYRDDLVYFTAKSLLR